MGGIVKQTAEADPLIGKLINGKHQVSELLAVGGMGRVYVAEDVTLGRRVAIKVIDAGLLQDNVVVERFKQEARATAAIGHPNIVQVFEIGEIEGGQPYLVMEYLEGNDLFDELSRRKPLSVELTLEIIGQVLFALVATHEAGIVHRDLKPENIFLTQRSVSSWRDLSDANRAGTAGMVKILDFGISRFLVREAHLAPKLTLTGTTALGTPHYIAPEQINRPSSVDERADLHAVGVIMFECLTGVRPYRGDNPHTIIHNVLNKPLPDVREIRSELPEKLAIVVKQAMAKNPIHRFRSAEEFINNLCPLCDFERSFTWSDYSTSEPSPQSPEDKAADKNVLKSHVRIAPESGDTEEPSGAEEGRTLRDFPPPAQALRLPKDNLDDGIPFVTLTGLLDDDIPFVTLTGLLDDDIPFVTLTDLLDDTEQKAPRVTTATPDTRPLDTDRYGSPDRTSDPGNETQSNEELQDEGQDVAGEASSCQPFMDLTWADDLPTRVFTGAITKVRKVAHLFVSPSLAPPLMSQSNLVEPKPSSSPSPDDLTPLAPLPDAGRGGGSQKSRSGSPSPRLEGDWGGRSDSQNDDRDLELPPSKRRFPLVLFMAILAFLGCLGTVCVVAINWGARNSEADEITAVEEVKPQVTAMVGPVLSAGSGSTINPGDGTPSIELVEPDHPLPALDTDEIPRVPGETEDGTTAPDEAASKGLSKQRMRAIVRQNDASIRRCVERSGSGQNARRTMLHLTVAPNGQVRRANVGGSLAGTTLGRCLEHAALVWRFPAASDVTEASLPLALPSPPTRPEPPVTVRRSREPNAPNPEPRRPPPVRERPTPDTSSPMARDLPF